MSVNKYELEKLIKEVSDAYESVTNDFFAAAGSSSLKEYNLLQQKYFAFKGVQLKTLEQLEIYFCHTDYILACNVIKNLKEDIKSAITENKEFELGGEQEGFIVESKVDLKVCHAIDIFLNYFKSQGEMLDQSMKEKCDNLEKFFEELAISIDDL